MRVVDCGKQLITKILIPAGSSLQATKYIVNEVNAYEFTSFKI